MEKLFEQPLKKSLDAVRKNIRKHIALLNKKYQKQKKQFQVEYAWDKKANILTIVSSQYSITAFIQFTKSQIIGYMDVPFLLKAAVWVYKDRIIKEVLKELNVFFKKI